MIDNLTQGVFNLVALRKESVDRNSDKDADWVRVYVALRKESVDRNVLWMALNRLLRKVALRKESVDRNRIVKPSYRTIFSRSPQGERG